MIPESIVNRLYSTLSEDATSHQFNLPPAGQENTIADDKTKQPRERELAQLIEAVRATHLPYLIYFGRLRKIAENISSWVKSNFQKQLLDQITAEQKNLMPALTLQYKQDSSKNSSDNELIKSYSFLKTLYEYLYLFKVNHYKTDEINQLLQLAIGTENIPRQFLSQHIDDESNLVNIEIETLRVKLLSEHALHPKSNLFYAQEITILSVKMKVLIANFKGNISNGDLNAKLLEAEDNAREGFLQELESKNRVDLTEKNAQIEKAESEKKSLKVITASLTEELQGKQLLQQQVICLETQIQTMSENLDHLLSGKKFLEESNTEKTQLLKVLQTRVTQLTEEKDSLQKELMNMQNKCDQFEITVQSLQNTKEEQERTIDNLQEKNEKLNRRSEGQKGNIAGLTRKVEGLQERINTLNQTIDQLKQANVNLEAKIKNPRSNAGESFSYGSATGRNPSLYGRPGSVSANSQQTTTEVLTSQP